MYIISISIYIYIYICAETGSVPGVPLSAADEIVVQMGAVDVARMNNMIIQCILTHYGTTIIPTT